MGGVRARLTVSLTRTNSRQTERDNDSRENRFKKNSGDELIEILHCTNKVKLAAGRLACSVVYRYAESVGTAAGSGRRGGLCSQQRVPLHATDHARKVDVSP